ncbi:MAG: DUF2116 family Zn-ribbon domain-containing protein [Thermoprotei archaeon]
MSKKHPRCAWCGSLVQKGVRFCSQSCVEQYMEAENVDAEERMFSGPEEEFDY